MITFNLNKTFKNHAECEKWETENIKDNHYNGYVVLCVMHQCACGSEEETLTSILCC